MRYLLRMRMACSPEGCCAVQGSPLMPDMLIMVNVTAASSIVIVSDSSRCGEGIGFRT